MHQLDAILAPRSVAIIGASGDKTRIGGRPVRYLIEGGFAGDILPINPNRAEVQGLRAYAAIEATPGPVDCAIIALPADAVLAAVAACGRKGVRALVVFSAGFAEVGPEGAIRQAELQRIAAAHDMRVLGPNCLGAFNVHNGAFVTFSGVFDDVVGTGGRLGLISQSGGYAGETLKLAKRRKLDFGTWITTGNEADIEFGEILEFMAESDDVDVILGYIEGIRSAASFIHGLEAARIRRKPVILLKVGRTQAGAAAAVSHTAAIAGADAVYEAVFRQYGAWRARTTEEMLDVAYAALGGRFPANRRIAILTNSGGIGVQAADFAFDEGLDPTPPPAAVQQQVLARVPHGSARNPVDVTGQVAGEPAMMADVLEMLLATGRYGSAYVCVGLISGLPFLQEVLAQSFEAVMARHPGYLVTSLVTASPEIVARYAAAGMRSFDDPSRAIRAIAALRGIRAGWDAGPGSGDTDITAGAELLPAAASLNETEAKAVLARAGIAGPEEHLATGPAEAEAHAAAGGRAVAIKIVSRDIPHKTEFGGVALNVAPDAVAAAVTRMAADVAAAAPKARIDGFLVTPMLAGGVECIVGAHRDPLFGPVIMFGIGGISVEIYRDVVLRVGPVDAAAAAAMVSAVTGARLLTGYRGRPPADVDALVAAIVAVSRLAIANADRLRSIEINPLLVLPAGQGAIALDAVIETGPPGDAKPAQETRV